MSAEPPPSHPLHRFLSAYSGEHGVYGLVLVTALIAVAWEQDSDAEVIIFVTGTVVAFWLAHIYAAVVASRATRPAPTLRESIRAGARHASGMLFATLVPAALLSLGTFDVIDELTAYLLALASGVVLLALIGWANAARNGSSWPWRLLGAVITAMLGLVVILLSILVH